VEWLKVKALSSSPSITKKKEKWKDLGDWYCPMEDLGTAVK
jgi:hypothetical protein